MIYLIFLAIFLIHWVGDFVLQTDKQAKGKSKNWSDLLSHTFTYSLLWTYVIGTLYILGFWSSLFLWFIPITFICHTATDYFTSRLSSRYWEEGKVHNFFVVIGFDQVLHYIQLYGTFFILLYLNGR